MSTDTIDPLFEELFNGKDYEIKSGHSYIVEDPDKARRIYSELVSNGNKGLCISRMHPDYLSREYGIKDSKWIANEPGHTGPQPRVLTDIVKKYTSKNNGSVVLLDALEYIMINNDFNTIMNMVENISEDPNSSLIIGISSKCFDKKELALLKRNFEEI